MTSQPPLEEQVPKKYWWVVAVVVPLGLAVIGVIPGIVGKKDNQPAAWVMPRPQPLPASVAWLPAAEALNLVYTSAPPTPPNEALHPQIRLEIFAHQKGSTQFAPLKDGDALVSRVNDYFVAIQTLSSGYLYVFQVDSSGKREWLFPRNESSPFSSGSNPVQEGEIIQIPPPELRFYLDDTPGVEHIYAVLSASRWRHLEQVLSKKMLQTGGAVQKPNALGLRGIGGVHSVRPLNVDRIEKGQAIPLSMTATLQEADGPLLVIERWFTHVDWN